MAQDNPHNTFLPTLPVGEAPNPISLDGAARALDEQDPAEKEVTEEKGV